MAAAGWCCAAWPGAYQGAAGSVGWVGEGGSRPTTGVRLPPPAGLLLQPQGLEQVDR